MMITGCGTKDQFRSYVKEGQCNSYSYASLAHPLKSNGSVDESVASVGCGNSLSSIENEVLAKCELDYGRKCLTSVNYLRNNDKFEYVQQRNIANARNRQSEQYYENFKNKCAQIGYPKNTTQNSDCVMRLVQQAEQMLLQQNVINQQQQDNAYMQMLQSFQILNQPYQIPIQTTCNKVGQFVNCTTR